MSTMAIAQALTSEPTSTPSPALEPARLSLLSLPAQTELWQLSARWLRLARHLERLAASAILKSLPTAGESLECSLTTPGV